MCACNITSCGNEFQDGGESSHQQKGAQGKGGKEKKEEETPLPTVNDSLAPRIEVQLQVFPKRKIISDKAWQERIEFLKKRALKVLSDAHKLYIKIQKDPFQRQVVKSTVYFSLGLKLFRDLARHLAPKPCGSQL